ncbi:MAG TPA: FAA hydrolase family protein [Nitratifractor sp.]|nr:FAA hydrolase family protein [Nitratifractor sp.]HHH20838.1 FAA hydrolase family protein [Nitratifractor sp.]
MKSINFNGKSVVPSKVVCVGRNYVEHIKELNNEIPSQMVLFNKPNSAITDSLRYFSDTHRFECELCFLMQEGKISGIGLGLDLTDKKAQEYAKQKGLPWERAKAFDNSAVLSDFIEFNGNLEDLSFKLYINDNLQQEADFDLMIYKPLTIVKEVQTFMTLEENDIIMSGTPKGVGSYKVGDRFSAFLYESNQEILKVDWVVL